MDNGLDGLADALDGAIIDVEPVEDDLEGSHFQALPQGFIQVLHEVPQHALFVSREVAVSTTLKW